MKTHNPLFLPLISLAIFSGCAPIEKGPEVVIPPPTISDAFFPPGKLETIRITGEYFKMKSTSKSDVVVSINGRNWTPAKKIVDSSPTEYEAEIPYDASSQIWVRVYGMSEDYSGPYLVHVQRR